jgi:selenoprotein W-related protein
VAQELLHTFQDYVSGVTLVPGGGGQFDVHYGDELIFSNRTEGRFPETRELRELLAARIEDAPSRRHASAEAQAPGAQPASSPGASSPDAE